jgi:hypothetical protein
MASSILCVEREPRTKFLIELRLLSVWIITRARLQRVTTDITQRNNATIPPMLEVDEVMASILHLAHNMDDDPAPDTPAPGLAALP